MKHKLIRMSALSALVIAGVLQIRPMSAAADDAASTVDQYKTQAFAELRQGHFEQGNDLLGRAAKLSSDPGMALMHRWTTQFDDQLKIFSDERHTAYDKAVENVKKVQARGYADAALDFANRAQLLSDDKKGFQNLPWVHAMVVDAVKRAAGYEAASEWYKAMMVYTDLAAVEPASVEWKEKLKYVTRRVRLLAIYDPEDLKSIQDSVSKERDAIEEIISPTTQPATKPAEPSRNENFKVDWHDSLRGVTLEMLVTSMHRAYADYYRDVNYRGLMSGGLAGIDAVINTRGLEKTFPSLADETKRGEFQKYIDGWKTVVANANADNEEDLINQLLSEDKDGMLAANDRTLKLPPELLITEFADGAMAGLDPFTSMIWPQEVAEFTKATQGEFSGIGVQILPEDNGDLRVVRPLPKSPAMKAGIKAGDVIARINGKSAKNITSEEAVKTITGPTGTTVDLTIRSPEGGSRDVTVRRAKIKVESVEGYSRKPDDSWNYFIDPENKIVYLRITSFSGSTVDELKAALSNVDGGCNGLIIDLRGNPGGLLQAAIGVCDKFLKSGTIVSTHPDRPTENQPSSFHAHDTGDEFDKPLVVLVNQYSASASEIVSGALKDDKRAILVGQRTFGKGSVQQIFQLDGDAILKLTTAHYYLPSGRCIHREENSTEWGVDPDLSVDMTPEQMRAAQEARQELEVAQAVNDPTALYPKMNQTTDKVVSPGAVVPGMTPTTGPTTRQLAMMPTTGPTTQPVHKTLLQADPQLSAALLVLRLEVTGGSFQN